MYLYMCLYITYILFIFKGVLFIYLFGRAAWRPLQWKHGVLTTGPPGKSPMCFSAINFPLGPALAASHSFDTTHESLF